MDPELCKELLEAAAAGDAPRIRAAIGRLYPGLKEYVTRLYRGNLAQFAAKKARNEDDILGHVAVQILKNPPTGKAAVAGNAGPPAATVMAWVKKTALRYLIDQKDADKGAPEGTDAEMRPDNSMPDPGPGPEAFAEAEGLKSGLSQMLKACYPKGLPVFDASIESGASDADFAAQLETSSANVYAIRRRSRIYCGIYAALLDRPHLADVELAKRCDVEAKDEFVKIAAKVRQFLATQTRRGR